MLFRSFVEVSGWESPGWYAGGGSTPDPGPLTWGRPSFWEHWRAEHTACRERVALIDMSFMAKFRVQGPNAGRVVDTLSANAVAERDGVITYTQWLDHAGMLRADVTVTRRAVDDYLVVATDTAQRRVETILRRQVAELGANATVTDVSGGIAQINVQGPRSRELLQSLTTADLSNQAFPFRTAREIELGFARVWCARITYVGELGYELFVASEQAVHVHDVLVEAGVGYGLRHVGLRALSSLDRKSTRLNSSHT